MLLLYLAFYTIYPIWWVTDHIFRFRWCGKCKEFINPWEYCFKYREGLLGIDSSYRSHPKCILTPEAYEDFKKNPESFRQMLV